MDVLKFTVLDDTTHVIGPGEYTVCGQAIPFGNGYVTDAPKKLCSDCKSRTKDTDEFGVSRAENEPAPEPLVDEPVEEAPKANKTTTDDAPAKATKSSGKA